MAEKNYVERCQKARENGYAEDDRKYQLPQDQDSNLTEEGEKKLLDES